jgi:hypothetical protein
MTIIVKADKKKREDIVINIGNEDMDINDPQLSKMYFLLNGYILHSTLFITEF